MSKLIIAFRKLRLQYAQVKSLKNDANEARYKEQRDVLLLLLKSPSLLVSTERKDYSKNRLYKYTNVLIGYSKNKEDYQMLLNEITR
jgi:hypothetical protein